MMRWAGWWLGPLLGVASAYAIVVLLVPRWLDCRHGTDAAALGVALQVEIFMTFWSVAALSGVVYALLYRIQVRWRTPLALAGAVVMAFVAVSPGAVAGGRGSVWTRLRDCVSRRPRASGEQDTNEGLVDSGVIETIDGVCEVVK